LNNEDSSSRQAAPQGRFNIGIDDVAIFPLALSALVVRYFFRAALSLLIHILDYAFPVLLQLMRFPLFTLRLVGDGVVALLTAIVGLMPISQASRDAARAFVRRHWSWIRQKISYTAFEQSVHNAFEAGMAWVFRKCSALTPGGALLVISCAVLWLPLSVGIATGMHTALIAGAASLPAWMQLLHPLATILAKSKLLVLPVYPAAWPQAKKHPVMQAGFSTYRYLANLRLMQKTGYRYRQTERALVTCADALAHAASFLGLAYAANALSARLVRFASSVRMTSAIAIKLGLQRVSQAPLIGLVLASYAAQYGSVDGHAAQTLGERTRGFFGRWSNKFSPEYYRAKDESAERDTR